MSVTHFIKSHFLIFIADGKSENSSADRKRVALKKDFA